jgi:uncharacterized protein (TIGR00369 family)
MTTRRELLKVFLDTSPYVAHLGIRLHSLETDRAELTLSFDHKVVTVEDVVHGGAIASLIDTAAAAAAWSDETPADNMRGSTVALSVDYIAPARGTDLLATSLVLRRGRSVCFLECDVTDPDGGLIAKALVTYRFG